MIYPVFLSILLIIILLFVDSYLNLSENQAVLLSISATSIFNNLLDNAIEAAKNSVGKSIKLSIKKYDKICMIHIVNSCDSEPYSENDTLIISNPDSKSHEFGFKSVVRTEKIRC